MKQTNFYHEFQERIAFSEGIDCKNLILKKIMLDIPGAIGLQRAEIKHDKNGTDYWIQREGKLRALSVDLKNREFCPIEKFGSDDACIEIASVYRGANNGVWEDCRIKKIGWTLDISKETDYIIYTWPNGDKLRYWILPFPFLCMASTRNLEIWKAKYKVLPAKNNGYLTLSIYPLRTEIAMAIREIMYGVI